MKTLWILCLFSVLWFAAPAQESVPKPLRVALIGTEEQASQFDLLLSDLAVHENWFFLERKRIDAVLREQQLTGNSIPRRNAMEIGRILKCDLFLAVRKNGGTFSALAFDAESGVVYAQLPAKATRFSADELKKLLLEAGRRKNSPRKTRNIALLGVYNTNLPKAQTAECRLIAEKFIANLAREFPDIVPIASSEFGLLNREMLLTGKQGNPLPGDFPISFYFFRGNDSDTVAAECVIREKILAVNAQTVRDAGEFLMKQPISAESIKDQARTYYTEYRKNRDKGGNPLVGLNLYEAACAYNPSYINPRFANALLETLEWIAQSPVELSTDSVELYLELYEYYLAVQEHLKTPAEKYPVFFMSSRILHYRYSPLPCQRTVEIEPRQRERALDIHRRLGVVWERRFAENPVSSASVADYLFYPCLTEQEMENRLRHALVPWIDRIEKQPDSSVYTKELYYLWQLFIRFSEPGKLSEDVLPPLIDRMRQSSAPELRLCGLMTAHRLSNRMGKSFQDALTDEVRQTLAAKKIFDRTSYLKTLQIINAHHSYAALEAAALLKKYGDDTLGALFEESRKLNAANIDRIRRAFQAYRANHPQLASDWETRRKELAVEHALRRYAVWEQNRPETDFPLTVTVERIFPDFSEHIIAVEPFQGDIWLAVAEQKQLKIYRFNPEAESLIFADETRLPDQWSSECRLHVSDGFFVLTRRHGKGALTINRRTQEKQWIAFNYNGLETAALLRENLYGWFQEEALLVKDHLPTGKTKIVSQNIDRRGQSASVTAQMHHPRCYASLADSRRERIYFFFHVYRVFGGPKTPGGMYVLDGKNDELAFSEWDFPDMVRVFYPISPAEFLFCGGAFVYRFDAEHNRVEPLLRLRDDAAGNDFFIEKHLAELHLRLPVAIGPGPFTINQFYGGQGHFPYRGYLWGETLGDVIDLKTGKIFYVKIPEFRQRALTRTVSPNGAMYHITANGIFKLCAKTK